MFKMLERFDLHSCTAIEWSADIARVSHFTTIDTDHILRGLLITDGAPAAILAEKYGITYKLLDEIASIGHEPMRNDDMPFGIHAMLAMEVAVNLAREANEDAFVVQDLHLLLALLCIKDSTALAALKQLNCDQQALCNEIAERLGMGLSFVATDHQPSVAAQLRQEVIRAAAIASDDQLRSAWVYAVTSMNEEELRTVERNLTR